VSTELIEVVLELSLIKNDQIQTNALRILGNLPRLTTTLPLAATIIMRPLLEGLASIFPKVRWNAASAIANFFSGPTLPSTSITTTTEIKFSLQKSIQNDSNLKVRIQALSAIIRLSEIAPLSSEETDTLLAIWEESQQETVDDKERGHKDQFDNKVSFFLHQVR
jgi:hypothetical protein